MTCVAASPSGAPAAAHATITAISSSVSALLSLYAGAGLPERLQVSDGIQGGMERDCTDAAIIPARGFASA